MQVLLHDMAVGTLSLHAGEACEFRLFDSYKSAYPRPLLGQRFLDDPDKVWRTRSRVPDWFSNLLPVGPLRELVANHDTVCVADGPSLKLQPVADLRLVEVVVELLVETARCT